MKYHQNLHKLFPLPNPNSMGTTSTPVVMKVRKITTIFINSTVSTNIYIFKLVSTYNISIYLLTIEKFYAYPNLYP